MSRLGLPGNQLPVTQPQLPPVSALTAAHGAWRPGRHSGRGPRRGGEGPSKEGVVSLGRGGAGGRGGGEGREQRVPAVGGTEEERGPCKRRAWTGQGRDRVLAAPSGQAVRTPTVEMPGTAGGWVRARSKRPESGTNSHLQPLSVPLHPIPGIPTRVPAASRASQSLRLSFPSAKSCDQTAED